MNIMILTPCAENKVNREYATCLLSETFLAKERLYYQTKYNLSINLIKGVSGLSKDRSTMASIALHNGIDKILFIDSDMSWTWPDIKALADSTKTIVSGIAPIKQWPIQINFKPLERDEDCFEDSNGVTDTAGLQKLKEKYQNVITRNTHEELEVLLVGAAFLMIDVKVLRDMIEKKLVEPFLYKSEEGKDAKTCWDFFPSGPLGGIYFGEDWAFCKLARDAGHPTYINHKVQIAHIGDHEYRIGQNMVIGSEVK